MITVSLKNIVGSYQVLRELADYEFSARTAFKIARILNALEREIINFEKVKKDIFEKYGERDENGEIKVDANGNISISQQYAAEYNAEVQELLTTNVEIVADPIQIGELECLNFTPSRLMILQEFITE